MKKKYLLFAIYFSILSSLSSQVIIEKDTTPVSESAYNKKITKSFSYLLLGENSPQQGISATLNNEKSNIKISGLLYSGDRGTLTIEADLAASNGVYFFDEKNGSEQGKITVNYYKRIFADSEAYIGSNVSRVSSKLEVLNLIAQAKTDYEILRKMVNDYVDPVLLKPNDMIDIDQKVDSLIVKEKDEVVEELKKLVGRYINSKDTTTYSKLKARKFDFKSYDLENAKDSIIKNSIIFEEIIYRGREKKSRNLKLTNDSLKNQSKILRDFLSKKSYILEKLEDSINDIELKSAEDRWAGNHIWYVGVSPFYERQNLKRFSYDENETFDEMFSTEIGDVYGITFSISYTLEKGKASQSDFKPENLLLRLSSSLGRASNIASFNNSTLNLTTPLGNDINGNPVVFNNSSPAFIGDTNFEYGFSRSLSFDAYYYPFKIPIGFFGRIAYESIGFSDKSNVKDLEIYPLRLGMLFSLTNKEKKKPSITLQAFIDRTDLNLKPSKPDSDLRFGFGIGLPINFK